MNARTILLLSLSLTLFSFGAHALRMTDNMAQSTVKQEPVARKIALKLPIQQDDFHWTFMKKDELLAGKLVLTIERGEKKQAITIFENGKITDGWFEMPFPSANMENVTVKPGEIYFLFQSSKMYDTAPNDKLELTLTVKTDLAGVGPCCAGVLPKGEYKTTGTYSYLADEYPVDPALNLPKETLDKLREMMNNKALCENWQVQWDITLTSEQGWLPPEKARQLKEMMKQTETTGGVSPFIMRK